jgi:hypothetical protein
MKLTRRPSCAIFDLDGILFADLTPELLRF